MRIHIGHYRLPLCAAALREETCRMIEAGCAKYGTMFEFYDDRGEVEPPALLRKGSCDPGDSPYHQIFHDYGWTATLYVDMVIGSSSPDP